MSSFKQIVSLVADLWSKDARQSVMFLGPPGIGKTALCKAIAAEMATRRNRPASDAVCEVLDLTSRLPEDMGGLPYREGNEARYAAQAWALRGAEKGAFGVICLDDLPAASPSVSAASRQLVLDRKLHDVVLSDQVGVIVTGNRASDKAGAAQLPSHFRNAVLSIQLSPDVQEWSAWYSGEAINPTDGSYNMDLAVPAFLAFKPTLFSQLPDKADATTGSFATPRTWAMLGRAVATMKLRNAASTSMVFEIASGLVGDGPATEFAAFLKTRQDLVPAMDVWRNPKQAIPKPKDLLNTPDRIISMVTSLAEVTATLHFAAIRDGKTQESYDALAKGLQAMAWVTQHNREHVMLGLLSLDNLQITASRFAAMIQKYKDDPDIRELREFKARAMARK